MIQQRIMSMLYTKSMEKNGSTTRNRAVMLLRCADDGLYKVQDKLEERNKKIHDERRRAEEEREKQMKQIGYCTHGRIISNCSSLRGFILLRDSAPAYRSNPPPLPGLFSSHREATGDSSRRSLPRLRCAFLYACRSGAS